VDRHGHARRELLEGVRGSLRVEVTGREPRSPARDREQRDVDPRAADVRHAGEEAGVASEVHGPVALDAIAERRGGRAERVPAAVVLGMRRAHGDGADLDLVALGDLHDPSAAAHEPRGAAGDDHDRIAREERD